MINQSKMQVTKAIKNRGSGGKVLKKQILKECRLWEHEE